MAFNRDQIFTQTSTAEPLIELPFDAEVVIKAEPVEESADLPPPFIDRSEVFTITSETRLEDIQQIRQFMVEIDGRAGEVSVEKVAAIPAHVTKLSFKGDETNRMVLSQELVKAIKPSVGFLYWHSADAPIIDKSTWAVIRSETNVRIVFIQDGARSAFAGFTSRAEVADLHQIPVSVDRIDLRHDVKPD